MNCARKVYLYQAVAYALFDGAITWRISRSVLKALEAKVANDGIILSDAQVSALEKKKYDDEACGEIETAHPGYLGSQDTFYVGNLKGVGRIYQQTFNLKSSVE